MGKISGKNFHLTITIDTKPAQIAIIGKAIKVTVDGPRDSRTNKRTALTRRTSASNSSDDCSDTSKIRRRMSTTGIPRPIPTLVPPLHVFPQLFNPFPFIANPPLPAPVPLNFSPHSSLLNPSATILRQPMPSFATPLPAVLTQRIRQLPQPEEQPIGTRTRRKAAAKIWKPYDIKS